MGAEDKEVIRLKILWQIYDFKNYTGGPVINTIRLLPQLKRRGYDVIVIVGHAGEGHPNADYLERIGFKVIKYKIPRYSEEHTNIFLEVVQQVKPEIFVSNISVQAAFAGRWARKWGIPVIHTHRGDNDLNNGTAHYFFKGPKKWRLTALVSVNKFLLDQLNGNDKPDFITKVIPSGVPISHHIASQDTKDGRLGVVYSGRIVQKQKRVREIVSAFITLAHQKVNLDFSLIGDGDSELLKELQGKVRNANLSERIFFRGRLEGEQYKEELAKNHIIVLLSDFEGIPGAVMDGMECGLVPVVLKIHGMDELVHHMRNGIQIKDREGDFYKAIDLLEADDELRKKLASKARETIVKGFSLERTVELWDELFSELTSFIRKNVDMKKPKHLFLPGKNTFLVQHSPKPSSISKIVAKILRIKKATFNPKR